MALKKQFNAVKYAHPDWLDAQGRPWLRTIHRDAHAQPFAHLAKAWARYVDARRAGQPAQPPHFKRKGRCRDSFYVANDKFCVEGKSAVLPKVGQVALAEALRTGALAARTALPEASSAVTPGTVAGMVPTAGGEVTPVRREHGRQDGSGQEENAAHCCARF